ncbi:MAG: type III CRISPR-associated RAMP protein Csx7 [Candidatus Helarchaeota archaeon]
MTPTSLNFNDFNLLKSRYIIKGKLINLHQLHIGTAEQGGLEGSLIDNQFIRIQRGNDLTPFIPGSSLKGVFRSFLERIASARGENVCDPLDTKSQCQKSLDVCIICSIFGSQSIASHVLISDAYPISENYKMSIKPGVAINRVTGAAQRGALYTLETISPETQFSFEMIIENIDLKEDSSRAIYLRILLKELLDGHLKVGGKTSAGLGTVLLKVDKILYITEEMIRNLKLTYQECGIEDIIRD